MGVYKVHQRAEVWFETELEAESFEEALLKAQEDFALDWEQLDIVEFQDDFWLEDENGNTITN